MMIGLGWSHSHIQQQTHIMIFFFFFYTIRPVQKYSCVAKVNVLLDMLRMGLGISVAHSIIH